MDKEENTEQAPLLHRRDGESEICRISEEDCGAADEAFMDRSVYYASRWDRKLQEIIVESCRVLFVDLVFAGKTCLSPLRVDTGR